MNNLEELTLKIKNIIESERAIHPEDIQYLNASHSALVAQIISSYNLKPSSEKMPQADMVVLGPPALWNKAENFETAWSIMEEELAAELQNV